MKKVKKGFTLVELLVVIVIIAILSSMMLFSGTEAQNAAQATKITEGFRSLTGALMLVYSESPTSADKYIAYKAGDTTAVERLIKAAQKYIKNDEVLVKQTNGQETAGAYSVEIAENGTWWLSYRLPAETGDINDLLVKKADDFGLKKTAAKTGTATSGEEGSETTTTTNNAYEGGQTVYYQAR